MNLRDSIRGFLFPDWSERALTPQDVYGKGWSDIFGSESAAGQAVTAETAMRAAVGACIGLLADDISTQPLDVFRKVDEGREEVDPPPFLTSPGGRTFDTPESYISDWVMSYGSDGNSFSFAQPNIFTVERLFVVDPTTVDLEERDGRVTYHIENDEVRGDFDAFNVIHVAGRRLPGQLRGVNPVQALKHSIGIELAANKWEAAFFREGGTLGGIISVPGGPETVDADMLRQQFAARHRGEGNWWKPAVLTGGAEYSTDRIKPAEAELESLWNHALEVAMRWFHIPPHLMSVIDTGAAARSSVEERGIGYVRHAVRPITTRFETVHSRLLPPDQFVKLNMNALMRGDAKARAEFYKAMMEAKVIRPRFVAALEDFPLEEAIEGWLETPNNNGREVPTEEPAAAPERSLSIDTITIGDESAERIADTAAAGAAVAAAEARKLAESVGADVRALTDTVKAQAEVIGRLKDDRERIESLLEQRNAPPDIRIDGDFVYYQRGAEVERKRVTRDERGRVVGMVAA